MSRDGLNSLGLHALVLDLITMSGRISFSAASFATNSSRATTSRSPSRRVGRNHIAKMSARRSRSSSIPRSKNPADFLEFREYVIHPIDGDPRGKATIEILGLNRDKIAEKRLDILDKLKALLKAREYFALRIIGEPDREAMDLGAQIDEHLMSSVGDSAEYAAMVRAAIVR